MLQKLSIINTTDNSGALLVKVIHLYKGGKRKLSFNGDFIRCSVVKIDLVSFIQKKAKTTAVIVRTKKENIKNDGTTLSFEDNSAVLLKKRMTPRGKELVGPASILLKRKKFLSTFSGFI